MTIDGRRDYGTITPRVLDRLRAGQNSPQIAIALNCEASTVRAIATRYGLKIERQKAKK